MFNISAINIVTVIPIEIDKIIQITHLSQLPLLLAFLTNHLTLKKKTDLVWPVGLMVKIGS